MTARTRYATPAAFRRALTDRITAVSAFAPWTEPQLQRQVAHDRLLERLYIFDDGWIVKGATALLARVALDLMGVSSFHLRQGLDDEALKLAYVDRRYVSLHYHRHNLPQSRLLLRNK